MLGHIILFHMKIYESSSVFCMKKVLLSKRSKQFQMTCTGRTCFQYKSSGIASFSIVIYLTKEHLYFIVDYSLPDFKQKTTKKICMINCATNIALVVVEVLITCSRSLSVLKAIPMFDMLVS